MRVDELTGASIGRYRVGGRLQVLPYASIHRGSAIADGRPVLVWSFRDPYATAAGFLEALQKLAGDLRAIQVPGLLHVLEIGNQDLRDPLVYLVMEDAASGFLVGLLQAGRAPGVFATTGRLASTLDQMHALGMVHGDIQPATVAVTGSGPVLAGHAIRTVVSRVTPEAAWVDLTRSFRPPEAVPGAEPTRTGDLWGLGALVYYLLVGRPPVWEGDPVPPSRIRPNLPPRVDRAVMRALATDPEQRFKRASDFYSALRGSSTPQRTTSPVVSPTPDPAQEPLPTGVESGAPPSSPIAAPQPGPALPTEQWVPDAVAAAASTPTVAPGRPAESADPGSPLWPTEPPLTPAYLRSQSLPTRLEESGDGGIASSESTQLIAMEPYRFEPKFRRRGGYALLWFLVAVVVAGAVLLVTGRLGV
ncbi:MAG: hypothetical protein WBA31_10010 [Candidatus Dormiibacterota bacterium]